MACVGDEGFDEGPVGEEQGVPVLPSVGACQRLEDVYTSRGSADYGLDVGEKVKWGSRVTPRTLGFLSRGSARSPNETAGWL